MDCATVVHGREGSSMLAAVRPKYFPEMMVSSRVESTSRPPMIEDSLPVEIEAKLFVEQE